MNDNYPVRFRTHEMEEESRKLFEGVLPSAWILRSWEKVDYGIDAFVEIGHSGGDGHTRMKGEVVSFQLKSVEEKIDWDTNHSTTFSGIKTSTANYWISLDVPVFLILVDLSCREIYWANASQQLRAQYGLISDQKSLSLKLSKTQSFDTATVLSSFYEGYCLEREHNGFAFQLLDLILNQGKYVDFLEEGLGRDFHLQLEPEEEILLFHVLRLVQMTCRHLDVPGPPISIKALWEENERYDKSTGGYGYTYELFRAKLSHWLFPWLMLLLPVAVQRVLIDEAEYWKDRDPLLSAACDSSGRFLETWRTERQSWWKSFRRDDPFHIELDADPSVCISRFMEMSEKRIELAKTMQFCPW